MTDQTLRLTALQARNPLGFLAAVGTLEVAARFLPDVRLHWSGSLNPRAVLTGVSEEQLHEAVAQDQADVIASPILTWPTDDLKVSMPELSRWAEAIWREVTEHTDRDWVSDLWCGLLSEFALANNGSSKPTHFYFTAGQQKYLSMVRILARTPADRFDEAWFGPWRMDSPTPVLGLDNREDRAFAMRASDPGPEKRLGVPGADWLAFRGLAMYPTATFKGLLRTRACDAPWKGSKFRWPVWTQPLLRDSVRSLLGDPALVGAPTASRLDSASQLAQRSVDCVYTAAIRRADQGGRGSFGPARVLVESVQ